MEVLPDEVAYASLDGLPSNACGKEYPPAGLKEVAFAEQFNVVDQGCAPSLG